MIHTGYFPSTTDEVCPICNMVYNIYGHYRDYEEFRLHMESCYDISKINLEILTPFLLMGTIDPNYYFKRDFSLL
jgi:hypothetical protein